METATAMEDTMLKRISRPNFLAYLRRDSLFEGFVKYLVIRVSEQQEAIADLVNVDSEQRLAKNLLLLARKLGKKSNHWTRIEKKVSHEELSQMIGTTRPRVTEFMRRFRELGLIEVCEDRSLIIKEQKLNDYLSSFY